MLLCANLLREEGGKIGRGLAEEREGRGALLLAAVLALCA